MTSHDDEQPEQNSTDPDAAGLRGDGRLDEAGTHRMIKHLVGSIRNVQNDLNQLTARVEEATTSGSGSRAGARQSPNGRSGGERDGGNAASDGDGDEDGRGELPEWCWFPPPPEPDSPAEPDPRASLAGFVTWFNTIYAGVGPKGSNGHIPACWRDHPAVAAEVATLAATWREAFASSAATARDAQYWHHTWRPGFAGRLQTWLGDECRRDRHDPGSPAPRNDIGAGPKADRWSAADTTTVTPAPTATGT